MWCHQSMSIQRQILITAVAWLCLATVGCGFRTGDVVLIPDGSIGWVRIYYQEAGSPVLPKEGRRYMSFSGKRTQVKQGSVENQPDDMKPGVDRCRNRFAIRLPHPQKNFSAREI